MLVLQGSAPGGKVLLQSFPSLFQFHLVFILQLCFTTFFNFVFSMFFHVSLDWIFPPRSDIWKVIFFEEFLALSHQTWKVAFLLLVIDLACKTAFWKCPQMVDEQQLFLFNLVANWEHTCVPV